MRYDSRLAVFAILAFAGKISLSLTTYGTDDVLFWEANLRRIQADGGLALYRDGSVPELNGRMYRTEPFNQPPLVIHLLRSWKVLSDVSGLPAVRFWLRATSSLADIGTLFLLYVMLVKKKIVEATQHNLTLFALSPVSILVSGFHGNTDPVMMLFVTLTIYLIITGRSAGCAGIAFGMAFNIKVVPVIFLPAILLYLTAWRARIAFCLAAGAVFVGGSMPYIIQNPGMVIRNVFGYQPIAAPWGFALLTYWISGRILDIYLTIGRPLALSATVIASVQTRFPRPATLLFLRCGVAACTFLFTTPGFGIQYLVWVLPWWASLSGKTARLFYIASAAHVTLFYGLWSHGRWYLATALEPAPASTLLTILYYLVCLLCWLSIGGMAGKMFAYGRRISHS